MNSQELRNLQEAYLEVVKNQQQFDEALTGERLKRAETKMKSLGRRKSTLPSREALSRVSIGKEGTGVQGGRKAPVKRGGAGNKGYGKVSGSGGDDMDRGSGNKAKRRAAEFDEGYVEFDKDRGPRKPSPRGKLVTKASQKRLGNILSPHHRDAKKQGERAEKMRSVRDTHSPEKAQAKASANKAKGESKKKAFGNRLRRSDGQGIQDSYDYYDIILSHLLDEGYAETPEAAEAIMVNMSEEWRDSIIG